MSTLPNFAYYRPSTVAEACALLAAPGAAVLAGGTDLLVHMRSGRRTPTALVSLQELPGMVEVQHSDGFTTIGAAAALAALTDDAEMLARFPVLADAARYMGSLAVRAQATVGGNLCNASPAADLPPALMALDATVQLQRGEDTRTMPLEQFFTGPGRCALEPGELCIAVVVPTQPGRRVVYERLDQRRAMDIAMVSVAAAVETDDAGAVTVARIVLGAVAPTPLRVPEAEAALCGGPLDEARMTAAATAAMAAAKPITDLRATAEYRRDMVGVLVRRALGRLATGGDDV